MDWISPHKRNCILKHGGALVLLETLLLVQAITWMGVQFGEKLHGNRKIARGEAECYVNVESAISHSQPCDYLLTRMF